MIVQADFPHGGRRFLAILEAHRVRCRRVVDEADVDETDAVPGVCPAAPHETHWDFTVAVREWVRRDGNDVLLAFGLAAFDLEDGPTGGVQTLELVSPDLEPVPGLEAAATHALIGSNEAADWLAGGVGLTAQGEIRLERQDGVAQVVRRPVSRRPQERAYA